MKTQVVIDTLRMAYQYLGKAVADNSMPNCAIPVEVAFKQVGLVLAELESEGGNGGSKVKPNISAVRDTLIVSHCQECPDHDDEGCCDHECPVWAMFRIISEAELAKRQMKLVGHPLPPEHIREADHSRLPHVSPGMP